MFICIIWIKHSLKSPITLLHHLSKKLFKDFNCSHWHLRHVFFAKSYLCYMKVIKVTIVKIFILLLCILLFRIKIIKINFFYLKVDGGWSSWVNSTCSVTCGNGIQSRSRTCDSPIPSGGGKYCEGSDEETLECSLIDCPGICSYGILKYIYISYMSKFHIRVPKHVYNISVRQRDQNTRKKTQTKNGLHLRTWFWALYKR